MILTFYYGCYARLPNVMIVRLIYPLRLSPLDHYFTLRRPANQSWLAVQLIVYVVLLSASVFTVRKKSMTKAKFNTGTGDGQSTLSTPRLKI